MNFPWARHYQRYEYAIHKGWINNKLVVDVGCGCFPLGSYAIATGAVMVFALDPYVNRLEGIPFGDGKGFGTFVVKDDTKIVPVADSVYDFKMHVDVAVAVEVFEHMDDPWKFITHLSSICDNAFITTPMLTRTGKTSNPSHFVEYSNEDFDKIVSTGFNIEEKVYQTGDMRIVKEIDSIGCSSVCDAHIVQMVWGRSKHAR